MSDNSDLLEYARFLQSEIVQRSGGDMDDDDVVIEGEFKEDVFTDLLIQDLTEIGDLNDGQVCYLEKKVGRSYAKVNAYSVSEDEERLDLVVVIYRHAPGIYNLTREECLSAIKKAQHFFQSVIAGKFDAIEQSQDQYQMVQRIAEVKATLRGVRIFLCTDGLVKAGLDLATDVEAPVPITVTVWDLERLYRATSSGLPREVIEVDFEAQFGAPLPCLPMPHQIDEYSSYLAIIPGQTLYELYEQYGERLLELNVRSFLQARGEVNRGIRDSIRKEPEKFFAYNNGISATADEIRVEVLSDGTRGITWMKGLQIVNGGQTTASIHRAGKVDRFPLDEVCVQAKISVVSPDLADEMVPNISKFANSQNKVNEADFSANNPFHRRIEELSRTIWVPGEQSQWFYERARGQYQVAKATRATTLAKKKQFEIQQPVSQKFTKTELATYCNAWAQLPHVVGRGAQKNFREFTIQLRKETVPDEVFFKRLVAKAILYRETQKLVRTEDFQGYRANIVAYTVAYLSFKTAGRLPLDHIWQEQDIDESLRSYIRTVARRVYTVIIESAESRNVTEWAKKEGCWGAVRKIDVPLPDELYELVAGAVDQAMGSELQGAVPADVSPQEWENIAQCMALDAETWFRIIDWGGSEACLKPWQIGIASTLAGYAAQGYKTRPSAKQAAQGVKIIEAARESLGIDWRPVR